MVKSVNHTYGPMARRTRMVCNRSCIAYIYRQTNDIMAGQKMKRLIQQRGRRRASRTVRQPCSTRKALDPYRPISKLTQIIWSVLCELSTEGPPRDACDSECVRYQSCQPLWYSHSRRHWPTSSLASLTLYECSRVRCS